MKRVKVTKRIPSKKRAGERGGTKTYECNSNRKPVIEGDGGAPSFKTSLENLRERLWKGSK